MKKYSEAGKGDKPRPGISPKKWAERWDKIFNKKNKNIRYVYSSEDCKVDKDGGPYEIDLSEISKSKSKNK